MKTKFSIWILALALMYYGNHYTLNAQIVTGKHKIQTGTEYFDFSQGMVVSPEDSTYDIVFVIFDIFFVTQTQIINMGEVEFDSVFWAPDSGYQNDSDWHYGHTYVVRTREGHYAKFIATAPYEEGIGFKWAYQTNGSRNLDTITGIHNDHSTDLTPASFWLSSSFPNPFKKQTRFRFLVPPAQHFTLRIYDIQAREVKTLINGQAPLGQTELSWDGTDRNGRSVANAVYIVVLETGKVTFSRKVILQR